MCCYALQAQVDKSKQTWLDGEVIEKPPLQVTLPGHECLLTVADMGSMTPLRFKSFWTVRLSSCFVAPVICLCRLMIAYG